MSERADKRVPVTASTKRLLDEAKDDGKTYDLWIREQLGAAGDG
jgi:hypothetical protein